jgi:CBS domain-containing protein
MSNRYPELQRQDFQNALKDLDTYIDVTMEDLIQINQMAIKHAQMRNVEQLFVRDLMTADVVTVTPGTSVRDAARLLLEQRISGLPVIDQENRLVGIVTEADFLSVMGVPSHHPAHSLWQTLESMFKHPQQPVVNKQNKVAEIMISEVVTVMPDNTLHEVIDTMRHHHVKRLVVVDKDRHVQGIITRSNLVQVLLQKIL